jgi:hypothetical protein
MSFKIPPTPECTTFQMPESRSSMSMTTPAARAPAGSPAMVRAVPCDPSIDACARAMGGNDPAVAYAAAMLWYHGYPDRHHQESWK